MASASDNLTLVSSLALRVSVYIFLRWVSLYQLKAQPAAMYWVPY